MKRSTRIISLGLSLILFISVALFMWIDPDITLAQSKAGKASGKASGKVSMTLPEPKTGSPLSNSNLGTPLPQNLFIELSKLLNPAVVSIFSSQNVQPQYPGQYRDPMEDLFNQFFGAPFGGPGGGFGGRGGGMAPRPEPQATGLGTGFIVREDGLILTNNHVVAQADLIKVQLDNNSEKFYEATILGRDTRTDVAVIKINVNHKLPVAQLGTSKDVQVGEWVAAFGNPYGHAHTMTKGIVSALGRAIPELNRFPFIQTDASINPGNSGGPLVNTKGLVIGINSAIDARAQGIGFAIPIDDVKRIVAQLEKDGHIRRGYMGIGMAPVTPDVAEQLGLPEATGIIVSQVVPGSPASKAGLRPYDIITEFNGKKLETPSDLGVAVGDTDVGKTIALKVMRFDNRGNSKKDLTLNVTLAENPDDIAANRPHQLRREAPPTMGQAAPHDLGFKVSDATPALKKRLRISPDISGAVIIEVSPNGPAARVGLQPGDVILDINRQSVKKASDVTGKLVKGRNLIRVARGSATIIAVLGTK